jgi:hypothetical protein
MNGAKVVAVIMFLLLSSIASAQFPNCLVFDKDQSQRFGAENGITLHKSLYEKSDEFIPLKCKDENTFWKKNSGIGYRFMKVALLHAQVDWLTFLVQHEAFGHGARYR